jgi:hypothetical protein
MNEYTGTVGVNPTSGMALVSLLKRIILVMQIRVSDIVMTVRAQGTDSTGTRYVEEKRTSLHHDHTSGLLHDKTGRPH